MTNTHTKPVEAAHVRWEPAIAYEITTRTVSRMKWLTWAKPRLRSASISTMMEVAPVEVLIQSDCVVRASNDVAGDATYLYCPSEYAPGGVPYTFASALRYGKAKLIDVLDKGVGNG